FYIGGHPMTGSERSGLAGADPYLFQNSIFILTPGVRSQGQGLERAREIVTACGARAVLMTPGEHDLVVAAVSHLPYLLAVSLVNTVAGLEEQRGDVWRFAAGGFRDTTRVASGSPQMWRDISLSNRSLLEVLNRFKGDLQRVEEMLAAANESELAGHFLRARENRKKIPTTAKGLLPKLHELVVRAEDRPGVIGEIASTLGRSGVNISDIEILRVREGEGGTIRLGFTSGEALEQAQYLLQSLGYPVRKRE
ncbi:MAG: prephenate dehydrogenase/arogenate dehydrogenase family protein, partial [Firmicutes bacterium]|nr:prephenate dehydrogenase/arogenate dehydrogenase family protein [Bacillota bacterium]